VDIIPAAVTVRKRLPVAAQATTVFIGDAAVPIKIIPARPSN
jgi:hypothetical protein